MLISDDLGGPEIITMSLSANGGEFNEGGEGNSSKTLTRTNQL